MEFFKSPLGDLGVKRMSRDEFLKSPLGDLGANREGYLITTRIKGFKIEQIFTKTTIPT
ncbi:MAG: hypothetical protein WAL29_11315 [Bacteroidales bacterium]